MPHHQIAAILIIVVDARGRWLTQPGHAAAPAWQWWSSMIVVHHPLVPSLPWSKERAIGSGVGVGQDGTTTTPTKHKREKSCSLLRELPALAEFLEAKAHMAHAASLHQPTRKRHTHRRR
jgi:hypothetical protein